VLVRKRTSMPPIEAALRAAAIPYTTDRRGGLLERIEVLDLRALLRFLVVPFSNLQLAHVLRSPLFRFADDDLIRLATMTGEDQTWWQTLNAAGQPGHFLAAGELLRSWIALAGVLPVHDLLDRIYHEGDLVLRYAAAVPQGNVQEVDQVVANLAAFLELALELDSGRYPSLPRFIEELTELTRTSELDAPDEAPVDFGDTVRLMTIHGAKGLEAPVVILADSHAAPKSRESNSILIDWPAAADAPRHFSVFGDVNSRGNARAALFADEEQRADEEDWNLFYVAATRAREVLILSGSMPRSAPPQDSWYQRAARVAVPPQVVLAAGTQPAPLPEAVTVRDFRPQLARGGSRRTAPDPLRPADEAARQRGIVLHRLLELLAGRRTDLDEARALAIGAGLTAEQAGEIAPVALAMLAAEHLQRFFDARLFQRAASEVEFVDAVGDLQRLDRVVEFDDEVWVLDYKSRGSAAGIEPHRAQLEQYVRLLEALHPDKRVRGAIVFADAVLAPLETDQPAT
jgi:ATP-dependent helicase/nuclease subunit A